MVLMGTLSAAVDSCPPPSIPEWFFGFCSSAKKTFLLTSTSVRLLTVPPEQQDAGAQQVQSQET